MVIQAKLGFWSFFLNEKVFFLNLDRSALSNPGNEHNHSVTVKPGIGRLPDSWTSSLRMGRDTNFNSNVSLFGGNQSINWLYQPGIDIRPCGSLWILVVRLAIKIEQWAQAVTEMGALKWMEEHCRNTSVAHGNQNCHFQKSWHCCILQRFSGFCLLPAFA